jgi:hypothetical protein
LNNIVSTAPRHSTSLVIFRLPCAPQPHLSPTSPCLTPFLLTLSSSFPLFFLQPQVVHVRQAGGLEMRQRNVCQLSGAYSLPCSSMARRVHSSRRAAASGACTCLGPLASLPAQRQPLLQACTPARLLVAAVQAASGAALRWRLRWGSVSWRHSVVACAGGPKLHKFSFVRCARRKHGCFPASAQLPSPAILCCMCLLVAGQSDAFYPALSQLCASASAFALLVCHYLLQQSDCAG